MRDSRRSFLAAMAGGAGALIGACIGDRRSRSEPAAPADAPRAVPLIYDAQGGLFLDVQVERRPARLLFDTGASCSTLARRVAVELGLAVRAGDAIEGSAGVVETERALATIAVPGLGERRIDAALYDFTSYDPACVGILGNDVLAERPFRLDYRRRELTWDASEPDATLPLELDHGIPRITIEVGGRALDVRLDSGAALAPGPDVYVNVTRAQAAELGLAGPPAMVFKATGTGGASLELPVHRIRDLRVGAALFETAFAIVQPAVGYFAREDAVGFLGNPALDELEPWFDYEVRAFGVTAGTRRAS